MKVSIITVVYNNEDSIKECIECVLNQTYNDIEFIVVDGKSQDGTIDIIKKYYHKIDRFISEKDKSNYDAYNKGLALSSGEIIAFLNSDDLFYDDKIIEFIVKSFRSNPDIEVIYGNITYVKKNNTSKIIRKWKSTTYYDKYFEHGNVPPHPGLFARKSVYDKSGNFDLTFDLVADHDFMFRILKINNHSSLYFDKYMVKMRLGGKTNQSLKNIFKQNIEILMIWKKYKLRPPVFLMLLRFFKRIKQFI